MAEAVFVLCNVLGTFPFRLYRSTIYISKFGLVTNACSIVFLLFQIVNLSRDIILKLQDQSVTLVVRYGMRIVNSLLLLALLARKRLLVVEEAKTMNKLFSFHNDKYMQKSIVIFTEFLFVIVEYVLYVYIQMSHDEKIDVYDLTFLIRLGFECQIATILITFENVYKNWNTMLTRKKNVNSMNIFSFRVNFNNLHELKMQLNKIYSTDLLLYFSCSQLILFFVCFDLIEQMYRTENANMSALTLKCLRFVRLFIIMTYVIWRWCGITEQVILFKLN